MIVDTSRNGSALVAHPNGRIDEETWEGFQTDVGAAIDQAAAEGLALILDLAGVDYMSSRGLRVLTIAKRQANNADVALTLARPNDRMREILAISRYDKIFSVSDGI